MARSYEAEERVKKFWQENFPETYVDSDDIGLAAKQKMQQANSTEEEEEESDLYK
jgi:hypothetical protein